MRHFAALLLLSFAITGCARLDRIENPPDWPQTWQGRTLFTTERGWYYADRAEIALEADEIVRDAHKHFRREAGRAPPHGLIIMATPQDTPIDLPTDPSIHLAVEQARDAIADDPQAAETMTDVQRTTAIAAAERMMTLVGASFQIEADAGAIPDLPPEAARDAAWVAVLPSRSQIRRVSRDLFEEELRREGVPLAVRMLMSPGLAWAEGALVDAMTDAHRFRIFEACVRADRDLPPERKTDLVNGAAKRMMENSRTEPPPALLKPPAATEATAPARP